MRLKCHCNKNLNSQWNNRGKLINNMGKQYFYAKQYNNALMALQRAYEVASSISAKN